LAAEDMTIKGWCMLQRLARSWVRILPRARTLQQGKVKVVPVLMKTYWGSGGIASRILDLGTRWR
jgi:hypothetical protein